MLFKQGPMETKAQVLSKFQIICYSNMTCGKNQGVTVPNVPCNFFTNLMEKHFSLITFDLFKEEADSQNKTMKQ